MGGGAGGAFQFYSRSTGSVTIAGGAGGKGFQFYSRSTSIYYHIIVMGRLRYFQFYSRSTCVAYFPLLLCESSFNSIVDRLDMDMDIGLGDTGMLSIL